MDCSTADIVEFPNSCTPEERVHCERAIGNLETLAEQWAREVNLPGIAKNLAHTSRLAPHAPDNVREAFIARQEKLIERMIEQAWIEGALHGSMGAFGAVRAGYDPTKRGAAISEPEGMNPK